MGNNDDITYNHQGKGVFFTYWLLGKKSADTIMDRTMTNDSGNDEGQPGDAQYSRPEMKT